MKEKIQKQLFSIFMSAISPLPGVILLSSKSVTLALICWAIGFIGFYALIFEFGTYKTGD